MKVLNLEHLLEIHSIVIKETGGSADLLDLGRLESLIASQTQHVFGEELHKTVLEKAAALMRGIIADHPFVDGNKRTGLLVGLTFLAINNCAFSAKEKELEDFAVKIAVEQLDVPAIVKWLNNHSATSN